MRFEDKIQEVRLRLSDENLDGWLLYDFRHNNELACQFLQIPPETLLTRRFLYWIPLKGSPVKVVHAVEETILEHLPGEKIVYRTWQELEETVQMLLTSSRRIAMEYSPQNTIPSISKVDAGTVDLIRSFGKEVLSSANLLQHFTCVWDEKKLKLHLEAANILSKTADETWEFIRQGLNGQSQINEFIVQKFMMEKFAFHHCISDDPPICAVNANSANPHYCPTYERSTPIQKGDFILIDLWCKKNEPQAVYADITRVAKAAPTATPKEIEVFNVVRNAQKAAIHFINERWSKQTPIRGCEVDRVCRHSIHSAGYGAYFIHRTGHNIDTKDHGNGAHIDDYETHDDRLLIPRTCFSIEPGIYLPGEFGVRLEFDVYLHLEGKIQITGGEQDAIHCF
jgi:Xaa-Pro dipeptidase